MFSFIATVFSAVWIVENWKIIVSVLACIIILLIVHYKNKKKRLAAYLALPVLYIGNKTTHTFHSLNCPKLSSLAPSNAIQFRAAEEAQRYGYTPCNVCKPYL